MAPAKPKSELRSVGVRPKTKAKLKKIREYRGWPYIDAIERMADRELALIEREIKSVPS